MRSLIRTSLKKEPRLEVVAEAADARQARDMIDRQRPDVLTLDIEMPGLDGVQFLEKIMRYRPLPVIVVSDRVTENGRLRQKLIEKGAYECIGKSDLFQKIGCYKDLGALVLAAKCQPRASTNSSDTSQPRKVSPQETRVIAIGASTGGVEAIAQVVSKFPKLCPATVITQHMPPSFCDGFAARLDRLCLPKVELAKNGASLEPGKVLIAPGGQHHLTIDLKKGFTCSLKEGPKTSGHRPSVDEMFSSVASLGKRAIGVILTGMGRDGAAGLLKMRENGAMTFGQDEKTCVVYGMPRAAMEYGAVIKQLSLDQISGEVLRHCLAGPKDKKQ